MATEPTSITTTSAADKAAEYKQNAIQKAQQEQQESFQRTMKLFEGCESLSWEKLTPQAQIAILMDQSYLIRTDDGSYSTCKLKPLEAARMVGYALENKLSTLGTDLFPTMKMIGGESKLVSIGKSSEAKAKMARNEGAVFGPAKFKELEREWPKRSKIKKPSWTEQDIGVSSTITFYVTDQKGDVHPEPSEYTAWLSEWYAGNAKETSYWDKNPMWMLRVRSKEKNISIASGVGQSDEQLESPVEVSAPYVEPRVTSTTFRPVQQELIPPPLATPPPRAREQEKG